MTSSNHEGYLYQGRRYLQRADFYNPGEPNSIKPVIFSNSLFKSTPVKSLAKSLTALLVDLAKNNTKIYLPYSGGLDSELLLDIAIQLNLPIVPVTIDLFGMNSYELKYADDFLKTRDLKAERIVIAEDEFLDRWLPELIFDSESLSFLIAGGYIAVRQCPKDGIIIIPGENPNVFNIHQKNIFSARHEYSLWPEKTAKRHDLKIYEVYNDAEVLKSYISYPAHRERLLSPVPFNEWTADHEYLSKEYIYTDPDFLHLSRRYSQHGWESQAGRFIYQKGMVPTKHGKSYQSYLNQEAAISFLLFCLQNKYLDSDLAKKIFRQNYQIPMEQLQVKELPKSSDFNRRFYKYLGCLEPNKIEFHFLRTQITESNSDGSFQLTSASRNN